MTLPEFLHSQRFIYDSTKGKWVYKIWDYEIHVNPISRIVSSGRDDFMLQQGKDEEQLIYLIKTHKHAIIMTAIGRLVAEKEIA